MSFPPSPSTAPTYRGADYILGVLTLILAGVILYSVGAFLQPDRLPPPARGTFQPVIHEDDLIAGMPLELILDGQPWFLMTYDGHISAVSGTCTYRGSRLSWRRDTHVYQCNAHGCLFDYNGNVLGGLATAPLERLQVRIIAGEVFAARERL